MGKSDRGAAPGARRALEAAVGALGRDPAAVAGVGELARRTGLALAALRELCREHYHATPEAMVARARVGAARRLLAGGVDPAEVAPVVGFASRPAFDRAFRRRAAMSAAAYRELLRRRAATSFRLDLPPGYRGAEVLAHLGRDPRSPSERVAGRSFALALEAVGRAVELEGEIDSRGRSCRVRLAAGLSRAAREAVHGTLVGLLGLRIDPRPFERRLQGGPHARLVAGRRGLGLPQTRDPFDGLIWVIAGQQVSLGAAFAFRRRLTRLLGRPAGGLLAPPGPRAVAELEPVELRRLGFSRGKAEYLLAAARAAASGELDLAGLAAASATEISERLLAVRGLGPWSVDYLRMRSYALADCVPVGDAGLARALQTYFALPERPRGRAMEQLMLPFAPQRSLATFHLWAGFAG